MSVSYAREYIDRLYDSRDISTLYGVITTLHRDRVLPERFHLFILLWNWCCATRSGMWQYYEGVTQCDFRKAYDLLNKYDLPWIAVVYQQGQAANRCHDLDIWIEENWSQLEEAAIDLIADYRDSLYPLPKM